MAGALHVCAAAPQIHPRQFSLKLRAVNVLLGSGLKVDWVGILVLFALVFLQTPWTGLEFLISSVS